MSRPHVEMSRKITLGKRLRGLRIEQGLSLRELSKRMESKIPAVTLSHYECFRHFPSPKRLLMLADYFNVTIKYLCGLSNVRTAHRQKKVYAPKKRKSFFRALLEWFIGDK